MLGDVCCGWIAPHWRRGLHAQFGACAAVDRILLPTCPALRWKQPRRAQPGSLQPSSPLMHAVLQGAGGLAASGGLR